MSPGRRGPAFKMPFAQMQAARSSAKKLATEIAGAKALERARRGGCCREERKAVCRRHGEPAQARPRPHRLEGGAARRAREERGVALSIAAIKYAVCASRWLQNGLDGRAAEWVGWRGCRMDWMERKRESASYLLPAHNYEKAIPFCRLHASGTSYTNTLLLALHRRGGGSIYFKPI